MKIVFISTMLPSGHYSQILTRRLHEEKDVDLIVYADKEPKNLDIKDCGRIKAVWDKNPKFVTQIIREIDNDQPDLVHLQHELGMYGGFATALIFPLLVLLLKIKKYPVVVTIHAVVPKNQIDRDFIALFNVKRIIAKPAIFKLVFGYIYSLISKLADVSVVHTNMLKRDITMNYGANRKKIKVVETAIPECKITPRRKKDYFFYFGYMVRRKGLGHVLNGFSNYILKYPKTKFKFVMAGGVIKGQEQSRNEILQVIKDKKLGNKVKYVGFINQRQQDALYNNAYAIILPGVVSVAASGPLYYAYGYRKCPIASKVGNLKEEVRDRETGFLCPNSKWAEYFDYAVRNPQKITMIEKNIEKIAQNRSPNNTAKKYVKIYSAMLGYNTRKRGA
jgi:glycosyltransferase involved in cell wall biosynthesis